MAAAPFEMLAVAKQGLDRCRRGALALGAPFSRMARYECSGSLYPLSLKSDEPKLQLLTKISSFGCEQDPRIEEILQTRSDKLADYAQMYEVERDQVVTDKRGITSSTRVYIGDLVSPED